MNEPSDPNTVEVEEILDGVRAFIRAEVVPRHETEGSRLSDPRDVYDEDGMYRPHIVQAIQDVRMAAAEAGYYSMFVPTELGGAGLGAEILYRVWQDVFHRNSPDLWLAREIIAHWAKGPSHVLLHANDATREKVLPDLLSGRTSVCFAMSEPDAGSDARAMRTRAVREGDEWVINGSKQWISNAGYADYAILFAATAPVSERNSQITAFLVPTDAPGFTVDSSISLFGELGGSECLIYLDDLRVNDEVRLGEVGDGFKIAMTGVSAGRLYNAGKAIGLARWALELALDYVDRRVAFGKSIAHNQGVMFPLAESAMELRAAHLLCLDTARSIDHGDENRVKLAASKAFATETATRAIDRSMQAHGAMGFTNEVGLTDAWKTIRKIWVADGTAEILRRTIAKELLRTGKSI